MIKTMRTAVLAICLIFQTVIGVSQNYEKLHDFNGMDGSLSYSELISDGIYLYGMTLEGGVNNKGTIFKISKDGSDFEKLFDFDGVNGENPYNSLTLIGSELYGVTYLGGANNRGTIFKINTDGSDFTKILDFGSSNGNLPRTSPYFDGTYLYGTTYSGGSLGAGVIYRVKPDGTDFSIIHHFSVSAQNPEFDLVSDGTYFYGVTFSGGDQPRNSTLYRVKKDGTDFQILHEFPDDLQNSNVQPSDLLLHNDYLYGVTFRGQTTDDGSLYRIKTDGTDFSILHDFEQATGNGPQGKLIIAGDYLYGTTTGGGSTNGGVIYRIKTDGTEYNNVFNFNTNDGFSPWCGLYFGNNSLYGVTTSGGSNGGNGTIFKFNDDNVTSVASIENHQQIHLYPNPASQVLHIEVDENTSVNIINIAGEVIDTQKIMPGSNTITVSDLFPGVYFLQTEKGGFTKFVKQ